MNPDHPQLDAVDDDTAVAVVGLSCRFGAATSADELWTLLAEGRTAIRRYPIEDLVRMGHDPDVVRRPEFVPAGVVLDEANAFDAEFFGYSPVHAEWLDPQQRILLETSWHALEEAGFAPDRTGLRTAVFASVGQPAVPPVSIRDLDAAGMIRFSSSDKDFAASRISYKLGLTGPSLTVQTACSSGLVAVHLAVESLLAEECDLAVVGAASLHFPQAGYLAAPDMILSPSGECRPFDDRADGTVFGNGAGAVVLRRLADALRDGDPVRAVIRGSAVNNDGARKMDYHAPSPEGQEAVLREALAVAGVAATSVGYLETHGTGTPLGDPVEYAALDRVYGGPQRRHPAAIGSVKSVVGHLNTAAGVAGLVKAVLALEHGTVPAQVPYEAANRNLGGSGSLRVAEGTAGWPVPDGPRRAAVSSFGIGGTNAHVVLEQAPVHLSATGPDPSPDGPRWVVLFARTDRDLRALAGSLADALAVDPDLPLVDVAWTLRFGRSHRGAVRAAIRAPHTAELVRRLRAVADRGPDAVRDDLTDRYRAWVAGEELPADPDLAGGRRIRLPGYPFARRVWPDVEVPRAAPGASTDRAPAGTDAAVLRRTVRPEDPLVADHRVGRAPVLPAAAQIDLLLSAAGERCGGPGAGLVNLVFHRPVTVTAPVTLHAVVDGEGEEEQVRLRSSEVHAVAQIRTQAPQVGPPAPLDLDTLRSEHPDRAEPDDLYRYFEAHGIGYGPAFRVLRELRHGPSGALARVAGRPLTGNLNGNTVSPFVVDGALQSVIGCVLREDLGGETFIPFAVAELLVHGDLPDEVWVLVRPDRLAGGGQRVRKYDVVVADPAGTVCLTVRGLALRPVPRVAPLADVQLYAPDERAVADTDGGDDEDLAGPLVLIGDAALPGAALALPEPADPAAAEALGAEVAARLPDGGRPVIVWPLAGTVPPGDLTGVAAESIAAETGVRVLALLRGLLRPLARRGACVVVPYPMGAAADALTGSGLAALGRSLSGENPRFELTAVAYTSSQSYRTFPEGAGDGVARAVHVAATASPPSRHLALGADGVLRAGTLRPMTLSGATDPAFRTGGRYWINGMGRLAVLLAAHLIDRYAAHVVLTGRSAADSGRLAELRRLAGRTGGSVEHHRLDTIDVVAVREVADALAASGPAVNGVVHCAGALRDGYILRKPEAAAREVIAPKLLGAAALDAATAGWTLDCFVVFSSISAALGSPGQADYAYANAAAEELVRRRAADRSRSGRSLCVAWPFWADGGMRPEEPVREKLAELGMRPMPTAAGLAVLESLLAGCTESATDAVPGPATPVVLYGDRTALTASFPLLGEVPVAHEAVGEPGRPIDPDVDPAGDPAASGALVDRLRAVVAEATRAPLEEVTADRHFDDLGIDSLLAIRVVELLERDFGRLSKTLLFECRSVAEVAAFLLEEEPERCAALTQGQQAAGAAPAQPTADPTPAAGLPDTVGVDGSGTRTVGGDQVDPRAVAIIGMAGRFPQADSLHELWENLRLGRDSITEVPADRWDANALYSADKTRADRAYTKWGGFINGVQDFDAALFHISPREAGIVDPQSRLFLESCWAALEDAGYTPERLVTTDDPVYRRDVGVFVGAMYGEYQLHEAEERLRGNPILANSAYWSIANRVSYFFDFQGPSVAVDTACSSALTTVHLAVESLRAGTCRVAIAGGVNVLVHPNRYLMLSQGRFASSDGRCRSFGAGGDGYVPGEGVGAVVLKPLRDALRDGDHIRGVIRGTAANHGGRTNGYTVPNPRAQADLVTKALRDGGLRAGDLDYIEAHGTGTSLGDPIEIRGLVAAFAADGIKGAGRLPIGSVKSNVGHLESAAGAVALAKVLLQLRHRTVVPSLHASPPNPEIDFDRTPFRVQREVTAWHTRDGSPRPLRAGISSFGAGGANAHVIVEEAPAVAPVEGGDEPVPVVLFLSARTDQVLATYARTLHDHLVRRRDRGAPGIADVAYTFAIGRVELPRRAAVVADSLDTLLSGLAAVAAGRPAPKPAGEAVTGWLSGAPIDREAACGAAGRGRRVPLPHYPFERVRCWYDLQIAHLHERGLGSAVREPELARPHLRDFGRPRAAVDLAPVLAPVLALRAAARPAGPSLDTAERQPMTDDQKVTLRALGTGSAPDPVVHRPAGTVPADPAPPPAAATPDAPVTDAAVIGEVTRLLAAVLYQEPDELDLEQTFQTLGVDSILGVEFVAAVNAAYPVEVKATELYDHPTPAAFARLVAGRLVTEPSPPLTPPVPAGPTAPAAPAAVATEVATVLREELARTLYSEPADIDDEATFNTLGLDSVLGVEFVAFINDRYGLDEKAGVLYDQPTVHALARYVAARQALTAAPTAAPTADVEALLDAVRDDRMSVEQALALLART
jgi:acyl transferase domain-containing protein